MLRLLAPRKFSGEYKEIKQKGRVKRKKKVKLNKKQKNRFEPISYFYRLHQTLFNLFKSIV